MRLLLSRLTIIAATGVALLVAGIPSRVTADDYERQLPIRLKLFCGEQNESGDDEIYVTGSYTWFDRSWKSFHIWSGDMRDDDSSRQAMETQVSSVRLLPGQTIVYTINVLEDDGQNYKPGIEMATRVAAAVAGALGAGDVSAVLSGINGFDWMRAIGWDGRNSDDYIGTFDVVLSRNQNGSLYWKINPRVRSRMYSNGIVQLDGDGARYYAYLYFDGKWIGN